MGEAAYIFFVPILGHWRPDHIQLSLLCFVVLFSLFHLSSVYFFPFFMYACPSLSLWGWVEGNVCVVVVFVFLHSELFFSSWR